MPSVYLGGGVLEIVQMHDIIFGHIRYLLSCLLTNVLQLLDT